MSAEPGSRQSTLRAAFEATGSGGWLMRAIVDGGLDRANGYRLVFELGDDRMRGARQATEARLIAGHVDVIDTDWLSLARHRAAGLPLAAAAPYGAIFGGLVAPRDGALRSPTDLPGKRIGVVHAQDKNWLLLRAVCRAQHDFDPALRAQCVETGSKTALRQALLDGRVDGALLYWHQVPALVAGGEFVEVCDLIDLLPDLPGVATVPSTFFVFHDAMLAGQPALVRAFARSVAEAAVRLRADAQLWARVSGGAADAGDGVEAALRRKWLARVGLPWTPDMIGALGALAARLAGAAPGDAPQQLPDGTFAAGFLL